MALMMEMKKVSRRKLVAIKNAISGMRDAGQKMQSRGCPMSILTKVLLKSEGHRA